MQTPDQLGVRDVRKSKDEELLETWFIRLDLEENLAHSIRTDCINQKSEGGKFCRVS